MLTGNKVYDFTWSERGITTCSRLLVKDITKDMWPLVPFSDGDGGSGLINVMHPTIVSIQIAPAEAQREWI